MQGKQDKPALRVAVVEGGRLWGDMLRLALSTQPAVEIVGTAKGSDDVLSLTNSLRPDVVLIDIECSGDVDPIEVARVLKEKRPDVGIVILASDADRAHLLSLPGPDGPGWSCVVKESLPDIAAVVRTIEAAAAGLVVLDPAILANTLEGQYSRVRRLTPRQMEVLRLMAKGYSNMAIARELVLEEKSVENHINAIFSQLVVNRDPTIHPRVKAVITYLEDSGGQAHAA